MGVAEPREFQRNKTQNRYKIDKTNVFTSKSGQSYIAYRCFNHPNYRFSSSSHNCYRINDDVTTCRMPHYKLFVQGVHDRKIHSTKDYLNNGKKMCQYLKRSIIHVMTPFNIKQYCRYRRTMNLLNVGRVPCDSLPLGTGIRENKPLPTRGDLQL